MAFRPVLAASAAVLFSAGTLAFTPPQPEPNVVAPGVWFIPGGMLPDRQPDGNSVVFSAPGGLIVMDTGRHTWHRQAILDFAKAQNKPIAAIVNSHWHLDHVSGNPDLRAAYPGLKVYASNAIDEALTGFLQRSAAAAKPYLDGGRLPPDTAEDLRNDLATTANGSALKPDIVIDRSSARVIAGKTIAVNLAANAATAGDVWIYDPKSRVVAAGDLVTLPVPFLDTACPAGWSDALARIARTPFMTLIPGHGSPMTHSQFATYRTAFGAFIACAASPREPAMCAADWAQAVEALPGADPASSTRVLGMAEYYVHDVLRAHGGKSAECRV